MSVYSPNNIYTADALEGLKNIAADSVDLVMTSPPYADIRKSYPGPKPAGYVDWFLPIAAEIKRTLKPNGSFVLNIKDKVVKGGRHPYVFSLISKLCESLTLIDTNIWVKKNGLGSVKGRRGFDYFEYIFHFCKGNKPVWNVDDIRTPYASSSKKRSESTIKTDTSNREARLEDGEDKKSWVLNSVGAYPKNVLYFKKDQGKDHPAAYHLELPTYFIKAHTNKGDLVVDPFCGRGTTCSAAKILGRDYIGIDIEDKFVQMAKGKFNL